MIGDRYADSLEAIVVVGDRMLDCDEFYATVKTRDGYPCLKRERWEERHGGAAAVSEMVRGLGNVCRLASDTSYCVKTRVITNGQVVCRIDTDHVQQQPKDLSPAKLVLIADYGKGTITEQVIDRIAERYAGREIIADWHPSRPSGFYHCATALMCSWGCEVDQKVPLIKTNGERGIELVINGKATRFPPKTEPVLDPCGAGDMVLATLGVGRIRGLSWEKCCQWAISNAALVCQQWGAVAVASPPPNP